MAYSTIRDAISTQVTATTGIGKVFKSRRYVTDWATFLSRFKDTNDKINVCWFWLNSATEQVPQIGSENSEGDFLWMERDETWTIELFYGFHDADDSETPSEFTFQGICENLETKFRFLQDLSDSVERSYPLQRLYSGMWAFGEVLCHKAEFQLRLRQRITY